MKLKSSYGVTDEHSVVQVVHLLLLELNVGSTDFFKEIPYFHFAYIFCQFLQVLRDNWVGCQVFLHIQLIFHYDGYDVLFPLFRLIQIDDLLCYGKQLFWLVEHQYYDFNQVALQFL